MELELTIAAAALVVLTAWVAIVDVESIHPTPRRTRRRRARREAASAGRRATVDPWIVETEPLVVGAQEDLIGKPDAPDARPVLAYIEHPRRRADPSRFIQTEVLVRSGFWPRVFAFVRLTITIVAFGLILGLGAIAAVRGVGAILD